jgi:hypothetical protein
MKALHPGFRECARMLRLQSPETGHKIRRITLAQAVPILARHRSGHAQNQGSSLAPPEFMLLTHPSRYPTAKLMPGNGSRLGVRLHLAQE